MMGVIGSLGGIGGFALPLWQAAAHHKESMGLAQGMHDQQIHQAVTFHCEDRERAHEYHEKSYSQAQSLHEIQMQHDTEIARRESLRDLWAQKTNKIQTLMIVDTLMFGCCFALTVEGALPNIQSGLPPGATFPDAYTIVYSALQGLSMGSLFLSVWMAMLLQNRMTQYRIHNVNQKYTCGKIHATFSEYYTCHCALVSKVAQFLFYVGSLTLIIAAGLLSHVRLIYVYSSPSSSKLVLVIAAAIVLLTFLVNYLVPTRTSDTADVNDFFFQGGDSEMRAGEETASRSQFGFSYQKRENTRFRTLSDFSGMEDKPVPKYKPVHHEDLLKKAFAQDIDGSVSPAQSMAHSPVHDRVDSFRIHAQGTTVIPDYSIGRSGKERSPFLDDSPLADAKLEVPVLETPYSSVPSRVHTQSPENGWEADAKDLRDASFHSTSSAWGA